MHYLLFYDVVDDYVARRQPFRSAHLAHARPFVERGELLLGGALAEPVDGAVLLFRSDSERVPEAFALADPYVQHGLVTRWRVRPWTTVVGTMAGEPGDPVVKPRHLYLGLCILGTVLPLSQFLPFLREHGLDPSLFVQQLFATPVSGFFGMDVLVSSLVLWVFVYTDGRRERIRQLWAPIAANLTVGVSLGLPLFLYQRETRRERTHRGTS
ncbi:MAG TPA: YciI-like protein [Gemmatimonadales bacterium]|nr:YciI-like protein [Gemmatimonadales bacterium]